MYTFMRLYTRVCRFWCLSDGAAIQDLQASRDECSVPGRSIFFYIFTMAVIICEILLYCLTALEYAVNNPNSVSLRENGSLFFIALVLIGVGSKTDRKWN